MPLPAVGEPWPTITYWPMLIAVALAVDPSAFVDQVEQTYKNNPPELLDYQRKEWQALFESSAKGQA